MSGLTPSAGRDSAAAMRLKTGVPGLDELLGGGLVPGSLTVLFGATGVGKTQFGVQFAHAGVVSGEPAGIVLDMTSRGDAQNHGNYAQSVCGWNLRPAGENLFEPWEEFFAFDRAVGEYLHAFDYTGKRVTRRDLDFDDWNDWQAQLNSRLRQAIAFLYGGFVRGVKRVVIDGVEPVDRAQESIQFNLFEYVYHQVLRKDPDWVARDLFREHYRAAAAEIARHLYSPAAIGCVLLCTSQEVMLDDLLARPLGEGDALSNANTLIYLGKVRQGDRIGRALHIAKHRGSAASDGIHPFRITDRGLSIEG